MADPTSPRLPPGGLVGRAAEIAAFLAELERLPQQAPRFITAISGLAGAGKTALLGELLRRAGAQAVAVRADELTPHRDALQLVRSLALGFAPRRLAEPPGGPGAAGSALTRTEAALARAAPSLEDAVAAATRAFVQDLNELGGAGQRVILAFDTYEVLGRTAGPWLLRDLLGRAEGEIACDLRLIVAGRERLQDTDPRWRNEWDRDILNVDLEPFSEAEAAAFLRLRCGLDDRAALLAAERAPLRLPLGLELWARAGLRGALPVDALGERLLCWWPDPRLRRWITRAALCRAFDQDLLDALLGAGEGGPAFAWLVRQRSLVSDRGARWAVQPEAALVLRAWLARHEPEAHAAGLRTLAERARARLGPLPDGPDRRRAAWGRAAWMDALEDTLWYTLQREPARPALAFLCQRLVEALENAPDRLAPLLRLARAAAADRADAVAAVVRTLDAAWNGPEAGLPDQLRRGSQHALGRAGVPLRAALDALERHGALSAEQRAIVWSWRAKLQASGRAERGLPGALERAPAFLVRAWDWVRGR